MKAVVLDTNTLISGLLWDGNEAKLAEDLSNVKPIDFLNGRPYFRFIAL